jgi:predicted ABC-type ATPase
MPRPVLFVLAGVNGAGKSSIGGLLLRRAGMTWFNPDAFARELMAVTSLDQEAANAAAWAEGVRRLDGAVAGRHHYAFETTLGGQTIAAKLRAAAATHDVMIWFCGLTSPEQHMARVRLRVAHGGHDIPEIKIRQCFPLALANLIGLMPDVAELQVYDNSADAGPDGVIPDPRLVLQVSARRVLWPHDAASLLDTPDWAKPLVEAALSVDTGSGI